MTKAKKPRTKRRAGRGSVLLIVTLLLSSALLRLFAGASGAIAASSSAPEAGPEKGIPSAQAQNTNAGAQADRTAMNKLLAALQERETRVNERERQVETRAKALAVAGEEIDNRLRALEETEARLRSTLALADGAAENDLAKLTAVYESMKPKDAAALFDTMEPGFAAGFLGRMRSEAAAAIMAGLSPDVAYSISVILAGRNTSVPKT